MADSLSSCKKIAKTTNSNKISPEAQNQYREASKLLDQGKTEDALYGFKKAVEIAPDYTEALHETGNCLHDLGRHEEASEYYSKALQKIGDRLCEIGRYEESMGHYWVAIRRYEEASKYFQPEFPSDPSIQSTVPEKKQDHREMHPDDTEIH
jgi:tetratricopeptide (TPR) repeat protein